MIFEDVTITLKTSKNYRESVYLPSRSRDFGTLGQTI